MTRAILARLRPRGRQIGVEPGMRWTKPSIAVVNGKLTENQHLNPDYEMDNDPTLEASGRDQQLEKAVEVMLRKLDGR